MLYILFGRIYKMNLFFTNWDPVEAASEQCDQYVIKIAIELALFLSAIVWRRGYDGPIGTDETLSFSEHIFHGERKYVLMPAKGPYRNSAIVHEASEIYEWLTKSIQNYRWGLAYGMGLVKEYSRRYRKIHRSESVLLWLVAHEPDLPNIGLTTDIGLAMPAQFKDRSDPVKSYKDYIVCVKSPFLRWKFTSPPEWYLNGISNKKSICEKYDIEGARLADIAQREKLEEQARKKLARELAKKIRFKKRARNQRN